MNGRGCADCGVAVGYDSVRCRSCAVRAGNLLRGMRKPAGRAGHCRRCGGPALLTSGSARCNRGCLPRRSAQSRNPIYCELDGMPMGDHPRCRDCTALLGGPHASIRGVGGASCDSCVASLRRQLAGASRDR